MKCWSQNLNLMFAVLTTLLSTYLMFMKILEAGAIDGSILQMGKLRH